MGDISFFLVMMLSMAVPPAPMMPTPPPPAGVQQLTYEQFFAGKVIPMQLRLKNLDAGWRRLNIDGPAGPNPMIQGMGPMLGIANAGVYYTNGQTIVMGDTPYLVAYAVPAPLVDPEIFHGEPKPPVPLTPDTSLTLCLLNLQSACSFTDIRPFDLKKEVTPAQGNAAGVEMEDAERKAREATLRANLRLLRNAIAQFAADTGAFPARLEDLVLSADKAPAHGADNILIAVGAYKGPYLQPQGGIPEAPGLPPNPFVAITADRPEMARVAAHWKYTPDGQVRVPDAQAGWKTLDGIAYGKL